MAVGAALQDRLGTVARIPPQPDDFGSLAVVLSYRTDRLLRLAPEKVLAIKLEFPHSDIQQSCWPAAHAAPFDRINLGR